MVEEELVKFWKVKVAVGVGAPIVLPVGNDDVAGYALYRVPSSLCADFHGLNDYAYH